MKRMVELILRHRKCFPCECAAVQNVFPFLKLLLYRFQTRIEVKEGEKIKYKQRAEQKKQ